MLSIHDKLELMHSHAYVIIRLHEPCRVKLTKGSKQGANDSIDVTDTDTTIDAHYPIDLHVISKLLII